MAGKRVIFIGTFISLFIVLPLLSLGVSADTLPKEWQAAMVQAAPTGTSTFLPLITRNYSAPPAIYPLWRFGIARARRPISDYNPTDVASMRLGWYVDWGAGSSPLSVYGMEYMPMIRVKQVKLLNGSTPTGSPCAGCPYATPFTFTMSLTITQIQTIAAGQPGATWVIGNEIERRDWDTCAGCGQDEIVPELYAEAYHAAYAMIKAADPTAQVAIGGMIQATPLRLKYLDRIWDRYQFLYTETMPVDVWNIHVFVLNEQSGSWGAGIPAGLTETSGLVIDPEDNKDFTIAQGHIVALRTWMQEHGQRDKPLIITEYGVNMPEWWCYYDDHGNPICPFTADQVRDSFMYPSFDYFLNTTDANIGFPADGNRLVQRWNWYSFDDDTLRRDGQQAFNGNLFRSGLNAGQPMGIAPLGTYWRQYVQPLPPGSAKPY